MTSPSGAAVVHGNTAYFSRVRNVYSYTLPEDKWTKLPPCQCTNFALAVVNDTLTAIGGCRNDVATNTLRSLSKSLMGRKWKEHLPPMPTERVRPAAVTTPTNSHLVVAGGKASILDNGLSSVETLNLSTLQWSSASSVPFRFQFPNMILCNGRLYLSEDRNVFSCALEELLRHYDASVWTRLADIPAPIWSTPAALNNHVLAIGGRDGLGNPTGVIYRYDTNSNSWIEIGKMPTPRSEVLVAVLPNNELIVVGGQVQETGEESESNTVEIGCL